MKKILALAVLALTACASRRTGTGMMQTVHANIAPAPGRELPPLTSITTRDFAFPWSRKAAPRTEFTAQIQKGRLRFTFDCDDTDLVIAREWRGESTLDGEDRVEIFFARDAALARCAQEFHHRTRRALRRRSAHRLHHRRTARHLGRVALLSTFGVVRVQNGARGGDGRV